MVWVNSVNPENEQNTTIQTSTKYKHVITHMLLVLQWKWFWGRLEYTGIGVRLVLCSLVCWVGIKIKCTCNIEEYTLEFPHHETSFSCWRMFFGPTIGGYMTQALSFEWSAGVQGALAFLAVRKRHLQIKA